MKSLIRVEEVKFELSEVKVVSLRQNMKSDQYGFTLNMDENMYLDGGDRVKDVKDKIVDLAEKYGAEYPLFGEDNDLFHLSVDALTDKQRSAFLEKKNKVAMLQFVLYALYTSKDGKKYLNFRPTLLREVVKATTTMRD